MRSRWLLLMALVAGIAIMALLWYTASRSSEAIRPQSGGTYVEGAAGAPSRINPIFSSFNAVDSDLTALIFSGLTRLGLDGEVLPDLVLDRVPEPDLNEDVDTDAEMTRLCSWASTVPKGTCSPHLRTSLSNGSRPRSRRWKR